MTGSSIENKKTALDDDELVIVSGGGSTGYDDDELDSTEKYKVINFGGAVIHIDADPGSPTNGKIGFNKNFSCMVSVPKTDVHGKQWIYVSLPDYGTGYICLNDVRKMN